MIIDAMKKLLYCKSAPRKQSLYRLAISFNIIYLYTHKSKY